MPFSLCVCSVDLSARKEREQNRGRGCKCLCVDVWVASWRGLCVEAVKALWVSMHLPTMCAHSPHFYTLLPHQADLNRDRARVNGDQKSSAGNHAKLSSEINAVLINYTKCR